MGNFLELEIGHLQCRVAVLFPNKKALPYLYSVTTGVLKLIRSASLRLGHSITKRLPQGDFKYKK